MRPEPPGSTFRCNSSCERALRARGFHAVAGVDEVGRGALFGPVVAAAVILSSDRPIRGLNDSKLLEPERRVKVGRRSVYGLLAGSAWTLSSTHRFSRQCAVLRRELETGLSAG